MAEAELLDAEIRWAFRTLSRVRIEPGSRGEQQQAAFNELRRIVRALRTRVAELETQLKATNGDAPQQPEPIPENEVSQ